MQVIAYVSITMSPKEWSKNTFGWARAEVTFWVASVYLIPIYNRLPRSTIRYPYISTQYQYLPLGQVVGALVNSVFLVALCFSITVESVKRFLDPEEIKDPKLILIVGGVGLGINLVSSRKRQKVYFP